MFCSKDINGYIDDNKALMRRMYGNLIKDEVVLPEQPPRTPASTIPFVRRSVNIPARFKRGSDQGKRSLSFIHG